MSGQVVAEMPSVLIDEGGWQGWIAAGVCGHHAVTRGQAISRFMQGLTEAGYDVRFTDLRARKVFGRLVPRGPATKGWETDDFPDHFIEGCDSTDDGAVPYWEVTFA